LDRTEIKALIRAGVPNSVGVWAEFGAGAGNFTWALAELLAPGSVIYAVDRDARALRDIEAQPQPVPDRSVHTLVADVTKPLDLPPLDGILMANVLHWIRPQAEVLRRCHQLLAPAGRLLIVEYDTSYALSWIPVPVPRRRFDTLAAGAGFAPPTPIGSRSSPTNNTSMYAALTQRRTP
jgi:SAM-dependent methyltransferase